MKTKATTMAVVMVSLTFIFGLSAMCQGTNPIPTTKVYEHLLDQYIDRCDAKVEMKASGLENVRRAAAIAVLKGTFARTYRKELIESMIQDEVEPKPYKVQVYLNDLFYRLVRTKKL